MKCPSCGFDAPVKMGPCPRCKAIRIHPIAGKSWEQRNAGWLIPVTMFCVLVGLGGGWVVYRGYRMMRNFRTRPERNQMDYRRHPLPGQLPVEHGGIVRPDELRGHGKLYFVPVGRQAFPAQTLADYYKQKFGVEVTVLAAAPTKATDCVLARKQCMAEELMSEMLVAYPEIARDPTSVMIALTDEDIYPSRQPGWRYTYSWHWSRIAIVSSRRVDPAFWGDSRNDAIKLASTKQMLTKYIAMMYFHIPESFDPTSIMYSPLIPDAGSDDLYESDLHSVESANGQPQDGAPCLYFSYSYETHKVRADEPALASCARPNEVTSSNEENFAIVLGTGSFTQRTIDLQLDSKPLIVLRRGYNTDYPLRQSLAFGWGANHSYSPWITSDGFESQSYMVINHEDGTWDNMDRITPGRGFIPGYTFESHDDYMYGARLTWEGDHYKLTYRDGAWSTFLPCVVANSHCYWTGYHDTKGNTLAFERGSATSELRKLTAGDGQGINFEIDDQLRATEAKASNGTSISYVYDSAGCLTRVRRLDGQITVYKYDLAHQMMSVAVMRRAGARPEPVLTNEFDAQGHIVKETLAGVGTYKIEYLASANNQPSEWRVTAPNGEKWHIELNDEDDYIVHSDHVKFPVVQAR